MHWQLLFKEDSCYMVILASTAAFYLKCFHIASFFAALLDNSTLWSFVMKRMNTLKQCLQRLCFVLGEIMLVRVW